MLVYVAASVFLMSAAYIDIKAYRIPNWLNVAALAAGAYLHVNNLNVLLHGLVWGLGLGLFFYFMGIFGAGDAKMFLALGSIVGAEEVLLVFMASLVLMVLWSLPARIIKWGPKKTWEMEKQGLIYLWLQIKLQRPDIEKFDAARAPFAPFVLFGYIAVQFFAVLGGGLRAYF